MVAVSKQPLDNREIRRLERKMPKLTEQQQVDTVSEKLRGIEIQEGVAVPFSLSAIQASPEDFKRGLEDSLDSIFGSDAEVASKQFTVTQPTMLEELPSLVAIKHQVTKLRKLEDATNRLSEREMEEVRQKWMELNSDFNQRTLLRTLDNASLKAATVDEAKNLLSEISSKSNDLEAKEKVLLDRNLNNISDKTKAERLRMKKQELAERNKAAFAGGVKHVVDVGGRKEYLTDAEKELREKLVRSRKGYAASANPAKSSSQSALGRAWSTVKSWFGAK